jgi:hypothetical protein
LTRASSLAPTLRVAGLSRTLAGTSNFAIDGSACSTVSMNKKSRTLRGESFNHLTKAAR